MLNQPLTASTLCTKVLFTELFRLFYSVVRCVRCQRSARYSHAEALCVCVCVLSFGKHVFELS